MKFTSGLNLIINIDLFTFFFSLLGGVYIFVVVFLFIGLTRLNNSTPEQSHSISIIVAARNEETRIPACLESLENLEYPKEKYEVIFVDDHSEDNTAQIIESFVNKHDNWKLIRLNEKSRVLRGKKNALLNGINNASGEIIFSTDADCVVPVNWLQKMSGYFDDSTSMVIGYSPLVYRKKCYFRLLQFDNLFSAIVAAAPTKLGYPFASAGRNIAYRRNIYENVGGFLSLKKYKSGDDIHLTTRFRKKKTGRIDYCADTETFVKTQLPATIKEVFQQQIRKNSKTFQLSTSTILLMISIFLFYLLLVIFPMIRPDYMILWLVLVASKFIFEFVILVKAAIIFKQKSSIFQEEI